MTSINSLLGIWMNRWIETLWSISWQVSILAGIVLIICFFSRKASPTFHYSLWMIVLIRLSVPINLTIPFGLTKYSETFNFVPSNFPVIAQNTNTIQSTSLITMKSILAIGWFLPVLLIVLTILWRTVQLQRLLKKDRKPVVRQDILELHKRLCSRMGFKRAASLCYNDIDRTNGPAVVGVFQPRIYLPSRIVNTWKVEDIEPLLLHELAHIKRYDLLINLLQIIVQAVYFFHPFVWYANWKIRRLREDICDDAAIEKIGAKKRQYSESILKVVEETLHKPIWGIGSIGVIENKNTLERRIKRIMSNKYQLYKKLTFSSIIVLFLIAFISLALSSENKYKVENSKSNVEEKQFDITGRWDAHGIIGGWEALYKDLKYPEQAKKADIEGMVAVRVLVSEDGTAKKVELLGSRKLGYGCEEAAIEAVKKQRWVTATQEGKPVSFWITIPVTFAHPDVPQFLPLKNQPKIIGTYEAIWKNLKYPEKAKKAGIEGIVVLRALVGKEGNIEKIEVTKGLGNLGCNEAAIEAVKNVRFTPARQNNKPVRFWFTIPIRFSLSEIK